ncbi:MAG: YihY/virulence factor BrkB family protein [Eubacteriales bacterium]
MKFMYVTIRQLIRENSTNNLSAYAASAAFFIFLSVFPMLLCICSIIPFTSMTENTLIVLASKVLPTTILPFAISLISEMYHKSMALLSFASLTLIWSAAKGILAIMKSLHVINHVEEKKNYVMLRLKASVYTIILMGGILVTLFIMVFGNQLVIFMVKNVPELDYFVNLSTHFRYFFTCILLTLLFVVLYTKIPNKKMKFTLQLPGALLASIGWLLFSACFSVYIDYFNAFNMYGSLSTVVIMMLWLYICMYILLVGAQINYTYEEHIQAFYKMLQKK